MEREFIDSHGQRYERSEGGIGSQSWKLLYHWESPCLFPTSPYFSLGQFSPRGWGHGCPKAKDHRERGPELLIYISESRGCLWLTSLGWYPFPCGRRRTLFGNWQPCLETHFLGGEEEGAVSWKKGRAILWRRVGAGCRSRSCVYCWGQRGQLELVAGRASGVQSTSQRRQVQHEKMGCTSETGSVSRRQTGSMGLVEEFGLVWLGVNPENRHQIDIVMLGPAFCSLKIGFIL